jgi:hypothetical protein
MTTVAENGYDGVQINPRWATNIYYNVNDLITDLVALLGSTLIILSVNSHPVQSSNGLIPLLGTATGMTYWPSKRQRTRAISLVSTMTLSCSTKPI